MQYIGRKTIGISLGFGGESRNILLVIFCAEVYNGKNIYYGIIVRKEGEPK